jgi:hypothetical protein
LEEEKLRHDEPVVAEFDVSLRGEPEISKRDLQTELVEQKNELQVE